MAVPALLLAAVATWAVDPGTDGVLVEDHRAPIVNVVVEFPAGSWSPWVRTHHAETAFDYQDRDSKRALQSRADRLAASIDLDVGDRSSTLRLRCLRGDLDAALVLVRDVLANTDYDAHELKRARHESSILWRGNDTDVGFRMSQASARRLFAPGDPRRLPYEGPDPVGTDPAQLAATRDLLIRLPGRVIGFAGDLTEADARRAAESLLPAPTTSPPADLPPRLQHLVDATGEKSEDVKIRNLTQVYLWLVRDSLPWNDPRRPAFLVADHVLGGHFYSRLYVALRHESGDTYGAGTRERGDVVPNSYSATTFTRVANASAIEAKLRAVLDVFHAKGITADERAGAVSYLRGSRSFDRQSAGQILNRYLTERRLGLAPGTLDDLAERAASLTLDDVNAFIRDYYDPAKFILLRAVPK